MRCRYMRVAGICVLRVSVYCEYGCVAGMIMFASISVFATVVPAYLWVQGYRYSGYHCIAGIILFQISAYIRV
jgi:hypothetical protein